jgi:hypothetical protein
VTDRPKTDRSLQLKAAAAIEKRILVVRERQVTLDEDLAELYGVETRRLIEQVQRNVDRFPADFMFQLTKDEAQVPTQQSKSDLAKSSERPARGSVSTTTSYRRSSQHFGS